MSYTGTFYGLPKKNSAGNKLYKHKAWIIKIIAVCLTA